MMDFLSKLNITAKNHGAFSDKWLTKNSSCALTSINPANAQVIASVNFASSEDYEKVITVAEETFGRWKEVPAPKRAEVIKKIARQLETQKENLGRLVSLETGKSLQEGLGEVQEMIDMADFAIGQSRMLYGNTMVSERYHHRMYEQWHPVGVVGIITAFNFPVAVWAWNAFIAAICGNTCVWKPSHKVPLCAVAIQHICEAVLCDTDFPGLFSFFIPQEHSVTERFTEDERVALISFTGSTAVGRKVNEVVSKRFGKTILELGGNNAIIVDETADLKLAVPAILFGAVGTAGQRCTTTRRLIVQKNVADGLLEQLVHAYQQIKIGDPLDPQNLMGPLIDQKAVEDYENTIAEIKALGGKILCGGQVLKQPGFYVEPTIVRAENHWSSVQRETFAPILYVMTYDQLDEAVRLQNEVKQGLSSALFTTNIKNAEYFLSHMGSDCGIANINIGTSGAEIGGAFGGEKETGGGREAGSDAWKVYMRRQTVTINWSDALPLAQGIQFIQ